MRKKSDAYVQASMASNIPWYYGRTIGERYGQMKRLLQGIEKGKEDPRWLKLARVALNGRVVPSQYRSAVVSFAGTAEQRKTLQDMLVTAEKGLKGGASPPQSGRLSLKVAHAHIQQHLTRMGLRDNDIKSLRLTERSASNAFTVLQAFDRTPHAREWLELIEAAGPSLKLHMTTMDLSNEHLYLRYDLRLVRSDDHYVLTNDVTRISHDESDEELGATWDGRIPHTKQPQEAAIKWANEVNSLFQINQMQFNMPDHVIDSFEHNAEMMFNANLADDVDIDEEEEDEINDEVDAQVNEFIHSTFEPPKMRVVAKLRPALTKNGKKHKASPEAIQRHQRFLNAASSIARAYHLNNLPSSAHNQQQETGLTEAIAIHPPYAAQIYYKPVDIGASIIGGDTYRQKFASLMYVYDRPLNVTGTWPRRRP